MFKYFAAISLLACSLQAETAKYHETLYPHWGQWFTESEIIFRQKTDFQDLVIFQNPLFGKVLSLDGVIQHTQADEAVYHEMMVHVPLLTHDNPQTVLIIGGGDGGIIREVLKHPNIERAVLVDIDQAVVDLSKKYLPHISKGAFDHPKIHIIIQDASLFVKECKETFDIIICDSTDPIGPGEVLFTSEFYGDCKKLLNKNGIFVNQNGVPFMQPSELTLTMNNRKPHFNHVTFYIAPVPTYAGGHMAFGFASDKKYKVSEAVLEERLLKLKTDLFYYTPEVHKASFALPNFMKKEMGDEPHLAKSIGKKKKILNQ
jgi:spermidine synthase